MVSQKIFQVIKKIRNSKVFSIFVNFTVRLSKLPLKKKFVVCKILVIIKQSIWRGKIMQKTKACIFFAWFSWNFPDNSEIKHVPAKCPKLHPPRNRSTLFAHRGSESELDYLFKHLRNWYIMKLNDMGCWARHDCYVNNMVCPLCSLRADDTIHVFWDVDSFARVFHDTRNLEVYAGFAN